MDTYDPLIVAAPLCAEEFALTISLLYSAQLNGHDMHAYMKGILEGLPSQPANRIGELLQHR